MDLLYLSFLFCHLAGYKVWLCKHGQYKCKLAFCTWSLQMQSPGSVISLWLTFWIMILWFTYLFWFLFFKVWTNGCPFHVILMIFLLPCALSTRPLVVISQIYSRHTLSVHLLVYLCIMHLPIWIDFLKCLCSLIAP